MPDMTRVAYNPGPDVVVTSTGVIGRYESAPVADADLLVDVAVANGQLTLAEPEPESQPTPADDKPSRGRNKSTED